MVKTFKKSSHTELIVLTLLPVILKLGMEHLQVYINDDPELTLTYFTTMSNLAKLVFVLIVGKISGERLQDHWSSGFIVVLSVRSLAVKQEISQSLFNLFRFMFCLDHSVVCKVGRLNYCRITRTRADSTITSKCIQQEVFAG